MKHMHKVLFITALASALNLGAMVSTFTHVATPYYSIRSQGTNAAREMVGLQTHINLCDVEGCYGTVAITGEYSQSFDNDDICECLFGGQTVNSNVLATRSAAKLAAGANQSNSCCSDDCDCDDCCIVISGSCVAPGTEDPNGNDWVADYFGLPTDYQSVVCFSPRIKNFVADVQGYFGFNGDCTQDFYIRFNLPITWTKWNLNYDEDIKAAGTNGYNPGYFNASGVARSDLLDSATDFFSGKAAPTLGDGVTFERLACSKWARCGSCFDRKEVKVADFEGVLGWNFVCDEDCHFGLNARFTAPTGTRPRGEFLFEPIIGNGKHWEFGGGLTSHTNLWRCDHSDASFNMYLDANVTHLFDACQTRCFDLSGRPNSRYWLAARLGANNEGLAGLIPNDPPVVTPSDFQFANAFAPVANLTCVKVQVKNNVQADIALKFEYATGEGFSADLGYNFWIRTCDKIKKCQLTRLETENWVLKGTSYVYGFNADTSTPVALAPSATSSTVLKPILQCDDLTNAKGPSITNGQLAVVTNGTSTTNVVDADSAQVSTSIQPTLLGVADIDFVGTKGLSNKIFVHLDYSWMECDNMTPFIGIGAAGEFGQGRDCDDSCDDLSSTNCRNDCDDDNIRRHCVRCSLSQWSVWAKGGLAFN